jgi:hypothetical protein
MDRRVFDARKRMTAPYGYRRRLLGRKVGNKLIVEGEEFHGHQDHPTEPSGNGPEEDAE